MGAAPNSFRQRPKTLSQYPARGAIRPRALPARAPARHLRPSLRFHSIASHGFGMARVTTTSAMGSVQRLRRTKPPSRANGPRELPLVRGHSHEEDIARPAGVADEIPLHPRRIVLEHLVVNLEKAVVMFRATNDLGRLNREDLPRFEPLASSRCCHWKKAPHARCAKENAAFVSEAARPPETPAAA